MSDNSDARAEVERGPARCYCICVTVQPADQAPVAWLPASASGWALPSVDVTNSSGYSSLAEPLRQALRMKFGLEAQLLSHIHDFWPPDNGQENLVAVVEVVRDSLPGDWQPLTADAARAAAFASSEQRDLLESWLRPSGADPSKRVAWARPGWRTRADVWINQQLADWGLAPVGPIATVKLWSISCVLRVPTSAGDYYFKAVPPLFGREPALTGALSQRHPGQVPEVVALDRAERWMLMRGFAGSMLRESEDLGVWQAALRAYARLQIAWRDDLDQLRRLGCPDRGPLRLAEPHGGVDDLLADEALMMVGQPRGLSLAQVSDLRALAPRLKAACAEWAAAGVPLTLEHGDYHAENVAVNDGQFIIFDWTDGCIAHPFVCLAALLERARPEWREPLTQAYLECWRDIASAAQIETALRLARPLGPLQMALSYYDIHHAGEELVQWQLDGGGPYFLREVLKNQSSL